MEIEVPPEFSRFESKNIYLAVLYRELGVLDQAVYCRDCSAPLVLVDGLVPEHDARRGLCEASGETAPLDLLPYAPPALREQSWRDDKQKACKSEDWHLFIRSIGTNVPKAKLICAKCPVAKLCRQWADNEEYFMGVAGGRVYQDRHRIFERARSVVSERMQNEDQG